MADEKEPADVPRRTVLQQEKSSLTIIVTLDGSRGDGAQVALVSDVRAVTEASDMKVLGTAASGFLQIDEQALRGWAFVAARIRGCYGYAAIRADSGSIRVDVRSSPKISVKVVDIGGRAVAGCRVLASSKSIPDEARSGRVVLFPGPRSGRVLVGATNDDGRWEVAGGEISSANTQYHVEVADDRYQVVSGARGELVMDGQEQTVRVAPLVATVVKVEGDDVLTEQYSRPTGPIVLGDSIPRLDAIRNDLAKKFPECIIIVGIANSNSPSGPLCRLSLCGRTSGWRDESIPMTPLADITSPRILKLRKEDRDQTVPFTVRLIDPSDTVVRGMSVALVSAEASGARPMMFPCESGVARRIPAGRYDVRCFDALLRNQLASSHTSCDTALGHFDIRILQSWRKVCIEPHDASGSAVVYRVPIRCTTPVGQRLASASMYNDSIWLPTGRIVLTYQSLDGREKVQELVVTEAPYGNPPQKCAICVE